MFDTYEFDETKKKLHLVEINDSKRDLTVDKKDKITCTVSKKTGLLNIGRQALLAMNMNESWYKLAYDSGNNIIAWRVRKELDNEALKDTGWKFIKGNNEGQALMSVGKILKTFLDLKEETSSYKKLEVKKYKDTGSMAAVEPYFYVQVVEKEQIKQD